MNKSESIAKLASALSKLQGEVQDVFKEKQGYGYKYADLSAVLEITRPLCAKYELAVTQLCNNSYTAEGVYFAGVETVLMHSSGEWMASTLYMQVEKGKMSWAQAAGAVVTYARRYALAAILGITQTDADADPEKHAEQEKKSTEYNKLIEIAKTKQLTMDHMKPWFEKFKVKALSELNDVQIKEIITAIGE